MKKFFEKFTAYFLSQKRVVKQISTQILFIKRMMQFPIKHYFTKSFFKKLLYIKKFPGKGFLNQNPWNYISLLALSILTSLGVFYFMSFLISKGKNPKSLEDQNVSIEFLLNSPLDELELRSRRLPKKPKEEERPPEIPKLKIQQTKMEKPKLSSNLPQLELPKDFLSDSQGVGIASQGMRDSSATPIFRIDPEYPMKARLKNIEGFVTLKFDITETGQVDNISVIQASPPQIFNLNAIQALRKWKYKPKIENGKAVRQKNIKVTLDFSFKDE